MLSKAPSHLSIGYQASRSTTTVPLSFTVPISNAAKRLRATDGNSWKASTLASIEAPQAWTPWDLDRSLDSLSCLHDGRASILDELGGSVDLRGMAVRMTLGTGIARLRL